ncbi:uncharacterized protein LOC124305072 isoform X1 [Neodiprion virginianus]|uniref:uncharacterized protein LOC124182596 isoform X1 n=2 Tax=Neodiprion fabricii TaxID=2872261 RepID=UPI001ED8EC45|nr:uncharacterized protein LOC124182596 isoform X1 [Neodiprion fabricii]XP_046620039.1 uncharacterized protein LOC124305072 isoform X1 [Neodiprion virginianus]
MGGEVSTSSTPRVGDCLLNPVRDGRDSKSSEINATYPIEVAGVERSSVVTDNRRTDIGSEIGTRHLAGVMADAGKMESLATTTPHEHNEATPTLRDGAAIGNKTKVDDDVNQGEEILLDETDTGNPDHAETETAGAPKSRGKRNIITAPIRQPSSGEYRLDANGKPRLVLEESNQAKNPTNFKLPTSLTDSNVTCALEGFFTV